MPLARGTRLGRYEIRSLLGAGGMGEVYLAQDTTLRRQVALKLLPADFTANKDRLRRFEDEAFAASSLNHPNILTIYEIGAEDGHPFIATEFIDGESLRQHMNRGRMELSEVLEIGIQMASAVAAAHAASIVHRDIKPENTMLRRDGIIKVLDFGLAKLTNQEEPSLDTEAATRALYNTAPGKVMGTVSYMSPEQARGKEVDTRTDIWSLGVMLYEMAAGRTPFESETVTDILAGIVKSAPSPLAKYAPDAPAEVERIITKMLEKNCEERYQTAKDLLIDLRHLKRRLDAEAEMERSATSDAVSSVSLTATNSGQTIGGTVSGSAANKGEASAARPTSSAEYVVSEIKRHKLALLVALLLVITAAIRLGFHLRARSTEVVIDSIAVLPFANTSNDPDTEYLSDGLTESIINSLTQLPRLRVIARSSVFRYKGKQVDPIAFGRELGVRAVLTGRLQQRGDNLMVSAELVDVRDDKQVWGEQYSRKASEALAVQQEISREISARLRLKLLGEERTQPNERETTNPEAYQFYLKGRYYWNKRTAEDIKKSVKQFQQAVDKDPNYALAYAGLADSFVLLRGEAGYPESDTLQKAKAFAQRALGIDDSLAEAHTTLAFIHENSWQWYEAEKGYKRAIELNPNYPTAHQWYSIHLRDVGRFDQALTEIKRAQELDPLSLVINENIAEVYLLMGQVNASIEQSKKVIELDPNFLWGHNDLGMAYLQQGRYTEALAELQKVVEGSGRVGSSLGNLGYGYAVSGKRSEALSILKELEGKYAKQEAVGKDLATVYAGLGEKDQAFAWLEKDFQARSGYLSGIRW
nr:protein kinase [Pyrinomonadaceae bacterium]